MKKHLLSGFELSATLAVLLGFASVALAHGGFKPLPKERQLVTFLRSSDNWTGIIITTDGKVIAETFAYGHEWPDTGEDKVVETLAPSELAAVEADAKDATTGKIENVPEKWDWQPVFGSVYHRYIANQQGTLLKRWGGRDLSSLTPGFHYAKTNDSPAADRLVSRLDALYQKYFPSSNAVENDSAAAPAESKTMTGDPAKRLYDLLADVPETPLCGLPFRIAEVSCVRHLSCAQYYTCEVTSMDGVKKTYQDYEFSPQTATGLFEALPLEESSARRKHAQVYCRVDKKTSQAWCMADRLAD